jgi:hypothetical protein
MMMPDPTNDQLNREMAELCGLCHGDKDKCPRVVRCIDLLELVKQQWPDAAERETWNPTKDMNQALMVVAAMEKRGRYLAMFRDPEVWSAVFDTFTESLSFTQDAPWVEHVIAATAICLAASKALAAMEAKT